MLKNIIANLFGKFWSLLSNFLFIPLYIKFLGFESYSIISFTLMISGIMAILDGGLTATLSREFARKDIQTSDKIKIFRSLETCYLVLVFLCIAIIFLLSDVIANNWITLKGFDSLQISFFLKIISFEIGFQLLFRFYLGGMLGMEKQVEANFYQIGWGVARNALVLIPLIYYPELDFYFIWQTISTILFTFLIKISLQRKLKEKLLFFSLEINNEVLRKVGKFAGGMMLIALISALNTQLDKITISKVLSLENLGYYTLAISLAQILIVVVNPITTALLPRLTAHYSNKEADKAKDLFSLSSKLISIIIFSIMVTMAFFAKDLVWIWTGNLDLAENIYKILPIVLLSYGMMAIAVLPYNIAIANGSTKINNILGVCSLFITLPGYMIFTTKYGALGAAYVFCIVQTLTTIIYLYFINKNYLKLSFLKDIMLKRFFMPLILITILGFILSEIPNIFYENRFLDLIWFIFCLLTTLTITLLVFISKTDFKNLIPNKI